MSSPQRPDQPPTYPGVPGFGGLDQAHEEPAASRQFIETGLLVLSLISIWPLMLGYNHWAWYVLAAISGVTLTVLLIRRIRRLRKDSGLVMPPSARPLPPGTPHGRKLSSAPSGKER